MRKGLSNRPVCLSVSNIFASYSDSGHLGSYLSTHSENTKIMVFLCLMDPLASNNLHLVDYYSAKDAILLFPSLTMCLGMRPLIAVQMCVKYKCRYRNRLRTG